MSKGVVIGIIVILVLSIGVGIYALRSSGEPQKVKVNSLQIANVYRDCTKNVDGNFRDTTIQTTVNFDIKKSNKYSLKLDSNDCILKIGPNNVEGFYMGKIPTDPNIQGVDESGAYMIVGGDLRGDTSDVLTFCCQGKCNTANLEICSN